MADYISRQAAIEAASKRWGAIEAIEAIPAVDVVPVRLGEWLDGYKMQTCSLCKCRGKKSWMFCPHCGARMIYGERKE